MAPVNEDVLEHQAAELLQVEIIPGTEVMRDVGEIHFTHAGGAAGGTVLIPHPSHDPRDPLNWTKRWKYITIISQILYTFITVMAALSIAPMYPLIGAEFDLNAQQLGLLTGVAVITLGYANFVIVPFSNIFGRRLTSIVFGIFVVATSIWVALAKSYGSLLAARALNGVATATNETLMVQVVADIFFLHERGFWTGVYFTAYFMGLFIGPIISGPFGGSSGWRSFFWLATGLSVFILLLLIVSFPETKFHRELDGIEMPVESSSNNSTTSKVEHGQAEEVNEATFDRTITASTVFIGKGGPTRQDFALWRAPDHRWKQFLIRDVTTPLLAFFFPIIFWCGLMVAGPANLLLLWNMTESTVLAAPPYNWTPSQVGLANFSFAVGGIVGLATAGQFSDWVAIWATKRNNGIREAEMRLAALVPFIALTAIGIVIGGVGYQLHWPWESILIIGYGFTGLSVTSLPTIATAYAIDCYKPIAGEIMVVATVLKNTQGFGMSYWVENLAAKHGYITVAMVQFGLLIGTCFLGIPIYIWGKDLRRLTKDSKMHRMEATI